MAEVTEAPKKKGTAKTETMIGQSLSRLNQATKSLGAATQEWTKLTEFGENLSAQIAEREDRIKSLDTDFKERKRQFEVQLDLDKRENINAIVTTFLAAQSQTAIEIEELTALREELTTLKTNQEKLVNAEVGKAKGILVASHNADIAIREAQYQQKEAENKATINSLNNQVVTLTKELTDWKAQLNDERKASTERARANSVGAINIAQPK